MKTIPIVNVLGTRSFDIADPTDAPATMTAEEAFAALRAADLPPERRAVVEDLEKRYRALVEKDENDAAHREAVASLLDDFEALRANVTTEAPPAPTRRRRDSMLLPTLALAAMGPHIEERPRYGYTIRTAEERRVERAAKEEKRATRRARKAAKKGTR